MSAFSERLNELLVENKIESRDFAKIIGADFSAVYCWLRGEYCPNFDKFVKIADYFGCSLEYLSGRKDEENQFTPKKDRSSFAEILDEIMKSRKISEYRMTKDTGLTRAMIRNWRTGKGFPKIASLIVLSDYLGVTLDVLAGRE